MYKLFTSESVTEGHPDKLCDQISDAVLDAYLEIEPNSRVACETYATTGLVVIGGEVTTSEKAKARVDIAEKARKVISRIGYNDIRYKFDAESCGIINVMHSQSGDISRGVVRGGAGDQGMMFGFACDQTEEYMPLPIALAHRITRRLADVRKMKNNSPMPYLRPDGKSQVTVSYHPSGEITVDTVVVSTQHDPEPNGVSESKWQKKIAEDVKKHVIWEVIPKEFITKNTQYHINPTGRFETGGPHGDTGLTGRKIIVDTYGGYAPHGGGAFSGKDPSKVDRSAAYAARYLAKNIVAAGLAKECMIQLAYAIGVAEPVSVLVDTKGTADGVSDAELGNIIEEVMDLTPGGITKHLNLRRPIFEKTAAYGHFGRAEREFTWENLDLVKKLRAAVR
ncbi:MAG: methionine adenosyltransferase [Bacteroidetes bacterium]|nr:methionine adenosyltransferase [Bacteroidota bacterium]